MHVQEKISKKIKFHVSPSVALVWSSFFRACFQPAPKLLCDVSVPLLLHRAQQQQQQQWTIHLPSQSRREALWALSLARVALFFFFPASEEKTIKDRRRGG